VAGGPAGVTHQYDLRERAAFIRAETVRLIDIAKTGHYTSVFSAAEILAALYYRVMRIRCGEPDWPERDRLVLSKGHVAVGVYPVLADLGFFDPALLDSYTRLGNPLGDHPDMRHVPGADFSSGSLGHGLSVALGMALAARVAGLPRVRVYALLGDGECNEGQIWEAAMAAAHHRRGACRPGQAGHPGGRGAQHDRRAGYRRRGRPGRPGAGRPAVPDRHP